MEHNLEQTMALLGRTPAALDALLRGLPETWTGRDEGPGTWSVFDVVGHLISGERLDWLPRARMILNSGESRTFEPFDRSGHLRENQGKTLEQLLDEFARLRAENLDELRTLNLRQQDMQRRGRHPAFGAVTLSQLLATWATHEPHSPAPDLEDYGAPVPRSGGSLERVPRGVALFGAQFGLTEGKRCG